ncbi:FIST C-terminal domain-containing protein, partial [Methanoregula sp.]|uniref:FIST C-terminal domain-containing protein n=1 Tax=Methanoregula sp. TaxID=2052170 RepID=UPI000CB061EA
PPVDLYREYLEVSDDDLIQIGVNFPLLIVKPDGTEVLRSFLAVDFATGALTFAGTVPQGAKVRFSSSFGYETIEKAIRDIREFRNTSPKADLAIVFSCIARHRAAGVMVNDELDTIRALWNVPVFGFFTYGEIGHNRNGNCDFYNESLSIALLSEQSGDHEKH